MCASEGEERERGEEERWKRREWKGRTPRVSSHDDDPQTERERTTGSSMCVTDCGRARSRQTKPLLGSHAVDEKADVDRSCTGQIM